MTVAFSKDFREYALEQLKYGDTVEEVALQLGIGKTVLYKWRKLRLAGCDISPRKRENKPRKANYAQIEEIIKNNPNILQREIAKLIGMSVSGVSSVLQRLGIALKKRLPRIKKQILQNKRNF